MFFRSNAIKIVLIVLWYCYWYW